MDNKEHLEMDGRRELALGLFAAAGILASNKAAATVMPHKKLVVVFQRFAADGLMELCPVGDSLWTTVRAENTRPTTYASLDSATGPRPGESYWKLHGNLGVSTGSIYGSVVSSLWDKGQLALIPGTHIPRDTRSHFTSQSLMEVAGAVDDDIGFCSRALTSSPIAGGDPILRGVCLSDYVPDLARGNYDFLSISDPANYKLNSRHPNIHQPLLSLWASQTGVGSIAAKTADAIDQVRNEVAGQSPVFDGDGLSQAMKKAAQFILANVGSQIITIDYGGWDHHVNVQSSMNDQMRFVNSALTHFKHALGGNESSGGLWTDTTVVFMTEFGRTLRSNNSAGTDHGWGSLMMVAGGSVNGGIYDGAWPGLAAGQAINATPAVEDYRHALAEIFADGMGINALGTIFPNFTPMYHGIL